MKTITLKNEHGETIELRAGEKGGFQVRHSDCTGLEWGDYFPNGKAMSTPESLKSFRQEGIDPKSPEFKMLYAMTGGGHLKLNGENLILSPEEIEMINEAIKQL
jgi:hypothetical protein